MNIYLDIETIPTGENLQHYLEEAKTNFKAPSTLTKSQAVKDLGLTGDEAKYITADDAKAKWVEKFSEEKAPEVAEEMLRKESFNGAKGQVCSISFATDDSEPMVFFQGDTRNEVQVLTEAFEALGELSRLGKPFFIGHYIAGFDLKFLYHRAVVNGVKPTVELPFSGRHGSDYFCTMQAWAGFRDSIKQEELCAALGIQGKQGMDGSQVWDAFKEKRFTDIADYNMRDVEIVRQIYQRLTFKTGKQVLDSAA